MEVRHNSQTWLIDASFDLLNAWKQKAQVATKLVDDESADAVAFLATLPLSRWMAFVVSAQVLCRWTMLPLSYWLHPAREEDGQGARVAQKVSAASLFIGTVFSIAIVWYFLRAAFWIPVLAASVVTLLSGFNYARRIGGVTGDCFGATNQLAEIAVYFCGVWNL